MKENTVHYRVMLSSDWDTACGEFSKGDTVAMSWRGVTCEKCKEIQRKRDKEQGP